jgi:carboxylesterase
VNTIPNSQGLVLPGGKIGVLVIHGFTGSPVSIAPWAKYLNQIGYTVHAPRLPGHGTNWLEMNQTNWIDWYKCVEDAYLELREKCDRVFIAGFSMGGALALRLCQIRGSEIEGLLLVNPSIYDKRFIIKLTPILKLFIPSIKSRRVTDVAKPNPPTHSYGRTPLKALDSLRKLWRVVERDLYLIDLPVMIGYSINDHVVDPANSETIIENIYSADIREVIFEKSFHNVALDYEADLLNEQSQIFIEEVLSGVVQRDSEFNERELIDAEFDSIVSGLALDQSAPTTYLDELDNFIDDEKFNPPNPRWPEFDQTQRAGLIAITAGTAYLVINRFTTFNIAGVWPGLIAICCGVATLIWRTARADNDGDGDEGIKL